MLSRVKELGTDEVLRLRLSNLAITSPLASTQLSEVVRRLLALQAQDLAQASWALGLRAPGSTLADLHAALNRGEIVRSWPMRGTLHFVTPADLRWILGMTATRTMAGFVRRHRELGLTPETVGLAETVARSELAGGGVQTRAEFQAALSRAGIDPSGQRGYHLIATLAHQAVLCWGPMRGNEQGLVLLDEWSPATEDFDPDRALREFVLRYFSGHGPATVKDFAWWSKLTLTAAKRGLELARDQLVEVGYRNQSHWMAAGAESPPQPGLHALPGFDEYLLGYQDRTAGLATEYAERIVPGKNGIFLPMIVSDGQIIGTWRRAQTTKAVTITPRPFQKLTAAEVEGFAAAAASFGKFLGLEARISGSDQL